MDDAQDVQDAQPQGAVTVVGMEIRKTVVREDRGTTRRPAILEKRPTC
ncbi:hypothetical protein [Streptomyces bungoensis]|nr:hypothetical protein [Streptomyces bungoensis]